MKFCKLFDDGGRPIENPIAIQGSISFNIKDGLAQAWSEDGKTLIAEMVNARVVWIGVNGTRIEGMEPISDQDGQKFRAMAWQQIY